MDIGLADRVYVIGGGSEGLGFATAQALVAEGARAVIVGRRRDRLEQARLELGDRVCSAVVGDLGDSDTVTSAIAVAHGDYGRLDGALVNTGGPPAGTGATLDPQQWTDVVQSVLVTPILFARAVAEDLRAHGDGEGAIAFVLSTSVRSPLPNLWLSNVTRPGLAVHVKDLADQYSVPPTPVRVLGLLPSRIETSRSAAVSPEQRAAVEQTIPLGRYGLPVEFGRVAAFALSPAASYITGSLITVDGGATRAN